MKYFDEDMMEMIWDIASDNNLSECEKLEIIQAEGYDLEDVLDMLMAG